MATVSTSLLLVLLGHWGVIATGANTQIPLLGHSQGRWRLAANRFLVAGSQIVLLQVLGPPRHLDAPKSPGNHPLVNSNANVSQATDSQFNALIRELLINKEPYACADPRLPVCLYVDLWLSMALCLSMAVHLGVREPVPLGWAAHHTLPRCTARVSYQHREVSFLSTPPS